MFRLMAQQFTILAKNLEFISFNFLKMGAPIGVPISPSGIRGPAGARKKKEKTLPLILA